jgi:hypothetical protein
MFEQFVHASRHARAAMSFATGVLPRKYTSSEFLQLVLLVEIARQSDQ